jgi:crossover junction endodeoxyribonuclease RuvC
VRILGIDPGSHITGYAVIDVSGNTIRLAAMNVIRAGDGSLEERLLAIHKGIQGVIDEFKPDYAVMETSYWGKSAQSSMKVAEARGAIVAAVAERGIALAEISPAEVKKGVTGRGQASKEQVEFMVKRMAGIDGDIRPRDASDALAIAIAYSNRMAPGGIPPCRESQGRTR